MSKRPSSYSNRLLLAFAASLALHGLFFSAAYGLRPARMDARVSGAISPVSVRLVALAETRASRSASAPSSVEAVQAQPAGGQKAALDPDAVSPEQGAAAATRAEKAPPFDPEARPVEASASRNFGAADVDVPAEDGLTGPQEVSFAEAAAGLGLPMPAYPELAKRWGLEGAVLVRVLVTPDGKVSGAEVVRSSGHEVLDSACLNTIRKKWRFPAPGREIAISKEFVFKLRR